DVPERTYVNISKVPFLLGQINNFLMFQSRALYALDIDLASDVTRLFQPQHVSRVANAEALAHG
ncbi:MAG: hypothetical protein ACKPKO_01930, partial [Candidatus Fonsibacter sp.]